MKKLLNISTFIILFFCCLKSNSQICNIHLNPSTVNANWDQHQIGFQINVSDQSCSWTVNETCNWLYCSPTTGMGDDMVHVYPNVNANTNSRSCNITITSGNSTIILVFNQYGIPESKNGNFLPTNGTIRVLIIFAEINYDEGTDPYETCQCPGWLEHQLPVWKDQLLDPYVSSNPQGYVTKYFKEASFGNYNVIGDYLINPLDETLPVIIDASGGITPENILNAASNYSIFKTNNNLAIADFDKFTFTNSGLPKIIPSQDSPNRFDFYCRYPLFPTEQI